MSYQARNASAYDRMVSEGSAFAKVASDDEVRNPLAVLDQRGWLPKDVSNLNVLCLAAGGGWQSILYASANANVTVVDISEAMLQLDQREATRRGLAIKTLRATMDDLSCLSDEAFDIVHQPVSTCYVPDILLVYREIARVLRPDGLYISQHKQPTSAQITHRTPQGQYVIGLEYYRQGPLPNVEDQSYREPGTIEYLHRWEDLIGGLCRAGMVLEDLTEPYRANFDRPVGHSGHRGRFCPPYVRLKARKITAAHNRARQEIWMP